MCVFSRLNRYFRSNAPCRYCAGTNVTIHPTPSHPLSHHLGLIFFSGPAGCVWDGGGGEGRRVRERGREREGERERERELVVYLKV